MNILWVQIRSWHALRRPVDGGRTYCGRTADIADRVSDTLPAGRSCESCLRIVARTADSDPVNEDVGE